MKKSAALLLPCLLLLAGACHKKSAARAPSLPPTPHTRIASPSPPAPLPEHPRPSPLPPPLPAPTPLSLFQLGERYFDGCDFEDAAQTFEKYLKSPEQQNYPTALFHFGMARFLAGGPSRELRKAEDAFRNLKDHFPDSPYTRQAEFILGQMAQIERLENDAKKKKDEIDQLRDELQRLKEIDMQRRPSRPPQ